MERNIGSTRAFQKCIAWDCSPQGSPLQGKYFFALGQIYRADQREFSRDSRALSRMFFSPSGGNIFRGLQMGVKWVFGQFVFGVTSSASVINKMHWCVAQRRLFVARDGQRSHAVSYTGPSRCWSHTTVQQLSPRCTSRIAIFHTPPPFDDRLDFNSFE